MLSSMVANANGVTEAIGNALWYYRDNGGWSNLKAPGTVVLMVDSHDPYGREELFVRIASGEIWSFTYPTGQWHDTGGRLDTMVANANGVTGTFNGVLYHYQDNGAWSYSPHAPGMVSSMVDTRDPSGREELFANIGNSTWEYVYATGQWRNTGRLFSSMIANVNGVTGVVGNALMHYQDNGGWYNLNSPGPASGIVSLSASRDGSGREELFVLANTGAVWDFVYATGKWTNTNGRLGNLTANVNGAMGTSGGVAWHYQDNGGWTNMSAPGVVASLVDSHDPNGREEVFATLSDGGLWELYQSGSQKLWRYLGTSAANSPPPGLAAAYKGILVDYAANTNGQSAIISSNIYLASLHSYSDPQGHNVAGALTIANWMGDVISVPFVGRYTTVGGASFVVSSLPGAKVSFQFNFWIASDGSLQAKDSVLGHNFYIYDGNNGYSDHGAGNKAQYYVSMNPNPFGLA